MAERQVIWWNVQRLLSPSSSPLSRALDATPTNNWTRAAYKRKLEHLAAMLKAISGDKLPVLVGLSEVENDAVAADLLKATGWHRSMKLVKDSQARLAGNDLVVFYDPSALEQAEPARSHNVHNRYATRDMFEVPLATKGSRVPLTVYSAHWPSRRISNSGSLRIGLADYTLRLLQARLKYSKDELFTADGKPKMPGLGKLNERWNHPILLFGDFNDSPFDTSVSDVLGAKRSPRVAEEPPRFPKGRGLSAVERYLRRHVRLFNPSWSLLSGRSGPLGSHYWQGDWYLLDQAIFSRGLINGPVRYVPDSIELHAPRHVDANGGGRIDVTTASGVPRAFDAATMKGVSDHLPMTFRLEV